MARETRTLGNQTFQDGNLKAAVDGDLVPPTFTAVSLSDADTDWEDYVDTFGAVGIINALVQAYGSGGGGGTYTNATPMPSTVGGLEAGTTFVSQTMSQMFDALLYPYQYPAFTAFAISGQSTPIEVGNTIPINRTFTWSTSNNSNIVASSIDLIDVTGGGVTIASGLTNDGTEVTSYPASPIFKTSATTHSFRIDGENTHSQTFSGTFTVTWQWKRFYGELTNAGPLIEDDIEGLVGGLASGFAGTYAFGAGGYKYLCYPASFGTASTFKDESTNLDVPFEAHYTVNVTNSTANPQMTSYRVHRSTNILGSSINIIVS
jgi:hypothetical protein